MAGSCFSTHRRAFRFSAFKKPRKLNVPGWQNSLCGVAFRNFESAFPHLIDFARFKIGHTPRKFPVFANYCKRPPLASTHICRKKDAGSPFFTCFSILAQVFFKCKNFFRPPDFRLGLSDFNTYICNNLYLIRGSVLLCLLQGTSVKMKKRSRRGRRKRSCL